ncbi:hypothetical protein ACJX0J_016002, partial [Zea mays]
YFYNCTSNRSIQIDSSNQMEFLLKSIFICVVYLNLMMHIYVTLITKLPKLGVPATWLPRVKVWGFQHENQFVLLEV